MAPYHRQPGRTIDVSTVGKRFLAVELPAATRQQDTLVVVSHWFDELKARVPIK